MNPVSALQKRAQAHGIQTSYLDNTGREQFASEETLRILLQALESPEQQQNISEAGWVEPVLVCCQRQNRRATLRMRGPQKPRIFLYGEDSANRSPRHELSCKATQVSSQKNEIQVEVKNLPIGYYHLWAEAGDFREACLIISAPRQVYSESRRQWGAFLPLYAAHSRASWGAGNFSDWSSLAHWVAAKGGGVIGALPILAAFLDYPTCDPSPYSPASRLFWNEFFIDISAVPEFRQSAAAQNLVQSAAFQRKLKSFRRAEFINYKEEWSVRRRVLELLADQFFRKSGPRRKEFQDYLKGRPEAEDYAKFRAMCDRAKGQNPLFPPRGEGQGEGAPHHDGATKNFHLYIQWIAQQQINQVLSHCRERGLKFYLDLPLGVNPQGYDAWRYPDFFATEVSVGAPPDSFFTKGQDWGFAPLHPRRMRELHYRYVIEYLRFQMRHTGMLRIDHVMGLHRLWWVPRGYPASAGAYVRYRADELYAILAVESHFHHTTLVGENLGTVPPEVNKSMDRHDLRRMYVLQYEQPPKGPLPEPERRTVAGVNTHDMPSFASHWKGLDILDRHALGLIPAKNLPAEKRRRAQLRKSLLTFLRKNKFVTKSNPDLNSVFGGVLQFIAQSSAETVLINLEDLWLEERSQNVPGTSSERPNWRRKTALTLEQIQSDPQIAALLELLNTGRSGVGKSKCAPVRTARASK